MTKKKIRIAGIIIILGGILISGWFREPFGIAIFTLLGFTWTEMTK